MLRSLSFVPHFAPLKIFGPPVVRELRSLPNQVSSLPSYVFRHSPRSRGQRKLHHKPYSRFDIIATISAIIEGEHFSTKFLLLLVASVWGIETFYVTCCKIIELYTEMSFSFNWMNCCCLVDYIYVFTRFYWYWSFTVTYIKFILILNMSYFLLEVKF